MEIKQPAPLSGAIGFVLITIFLDALGIGLLVPIIPELIGELTLASVSEAAVYGGMLTALFATFQFFATPVMGNLSDSYGRRPVMLLSLAAFGCSYLVMGFSTTITWLFVAQCLTGLFSATPSVAAAFIADVSRVEQRAKRFGALGAAFGSGLVFGPVTSGILAEWGTRIPIFVAAAVTFLNLCFGYFVLKETLPPALRRKFSIRSSSPWRVVLTLRHKPQMSQLLLVLLGVHLALNIVPAVWPYFTSYHFHWTAKEIGYSLGLYGAVSIFSQGFLVGKLAKRYGSLTASATGIVGLALGTAGLAMVNTQWMAIALIVPTALGFMINAALVGHMSGKVSPSEQGQLQGAVASIRSFAAVIAPATVPPIFYLFTRQPQSLNLPGAPFIIAAVLALTALWLLNSTPDSDQQSGIGK
jgi:DHA1 family tetracycline resistance protein-like MFS transporter